jgi:hypothetical protein
LVEAPRLIARGTPTNLRLLTGERITCAEAVVIWKTDESPGQMGLRFTRMAEDDFLSWEELLAFQGGPTPRASLRIPVDIEVACLLDLDTRLQGRIQNLSEGGLLVLLPRPVPPRTIVTVEGPAWLSLPRAKTEVVWNRGGSETEGILHGLRVLGEDVGRELFLIGTILRSFLG